MIPVAANHAGDVVDRDQLPGFVADVLPARNLFEDEKAHFVAGIEEMTGSAIPEGAPDKFSIRAEQRPQVEKWLENYQQLRAKLEAICEVNHELLRAKR